ncbi:protein phosphatase 1 regulatory subunit 15B [Sarotherodon galilaeus]
MKKKVEQELERLLEEKIIQPVKFSEWAAPIVPILKPDSSARICGDYKLTVNKVSPVEQYPIPRMGDMIAGLAGGEKYTKLDMSHAYQQVVLDDESRKYVTVNTHRGLFTYTRLPFGVSSSPAIFQCTMESVLQGLTNVAVYLDDIILTGKNDKEHLQTLDGMLQRLEEASLRLKRSKCQFMEKEVTYLGHRVDNTGLHPVPAKVKAVQEAPPPKSVTELKAYLGLLNFYNKFLPNLSTLLAPLHKLLRKGEPWCWGPAQEKVFCKSKELLQSSSVLVHYDEQKDLILSGDASPYGVGAVLAHRMPDGQEKPIGFASRTLNAAEKNYSQLDKEGLAVIFGVQYFHKYLYGRKFMIITDHKPLISLFHEMKAVPQMASQRIMRWAVLLRAYEYVIKYREGKNNSNADGLSRLPLPENLPTEVAAEEQVLMVDQDQEGVMTSEQLQRWTTKDPILSRVREYALRGWPTTQHPNFQPYRQRQQELSVQDGCVLWGARVVIPERGRRPLLEQLHQSHPGMSRMKGLARSLMWWPHMETDIEDKVRSCSTCQEHRHRPQEAPLHPWEWPEKPWRRIHIDYAGPFLGKMFLVIVDAHSKWLDVYPVPSATSAATIDCLRNCFSTHGLPEMVVSDNAQCFVSAQTKEFMAKNGITHVTSASYHPASNGLAERAVQTFKELMKKSSGDTLATKLNRALFSYRITPQSTTGKSPTELMMGRKLRCTLDLIHADLKQKVTAKQDSQRLYHDRHAKERMFVIGDTVYTRNYGGGPKWIPGLIQEMTGPVSYLVMLGNGTVVRRHVDQLFARLGPCLSAGMPEGKPPEAAPIISAETGDNDERHMEVQVTSVVKPHMESSDSQESPATGLRRSQRPKRPPEHLRDFVP